MPEATSHAVTQLLVRWKLHDLTPIVYKELRRAVPYYLRSERPQHTFFGDLSSISAASALDISRAATLDREWAVARLWLHRHVRTWEQP